MSCMPNTGGCERQRTDPFVAWINSLEARQYRHRACLDRTIMDRPQPEALYVEGGTNARMVIERKSLVWPPDYAKCHRFEHQAVDLFESVLSEPCQAGAFELSFVTEPDIGAKNLKCFVDGAAAEILRNMGGLPPGQELGKSDRHGRWVFRHQAPSERNDWEPSRGLLLSLPYRVEREAVVNPVSDGLRDMLNNSFDSCVKKFSEYSDARRILLIETFGTLIFLGQGWREVLAQVNPPAQIDEVWLAHFGWLTEELEGWDFQRLKP